MTLLDVISKFNTTPFLFIGSGITRRYLGLPNLKELLTHFAQQIRNDEFAYNYYEDKARALDQPAGLMPKVAALIQRDYNSKWFEDESIRTVEKENLDAVRAGVPPFKAEIAMYITTSSKLNGTYEAEIAKLAEISEKCISGVITTNYDSFIEDHFINYKKYIGQNELIFSALQNFAEIYKIHGSVEKPDSLIIDETDYLEFERKRAYLTAKLLTIFMEFPIIFLGYSLNDSNIQNIIKSIIDCLDSVQLAKLADRFVFVEHKSGATGAEVTPFEITIDGKQLPMQKITLSNFLPLYEALSTKQAMLPVRLLRKFKEELYTYTITNTPTANLRVASIEDGRLTDDEMVLAIGRADSFGLKGLSGISSDEWYRSIILGDLNFSADELLEYAAPKLLKQNSGRIPLNKYILAAHKSYPDCEAAANGFTFNDIISNSIRKCQNSVGNFHSVFEIWDQEAFHSRKNTQSLERATRLIACLKDYEISVSELESVLNEIFKFNPNILQVTKESKPSLRTNIRRLISIYDYLKWGKERQTVKELPV